MGLRRTIFRTPWFMVVLWFVAVALTVIVWVRAIQSLTNPKPTVAQTRPQAFVWGDRVFETRAQMTQWLHRYGISYEAWAQKHPAAVGIMYPSRRHVATPAGTKKRAQASTPRVAGAQPLGSSSGSLLRDVVLGASITLPLLALLLAAGSTTYARWKRRWNAVLPIRIYLVGAAAATAAGGLIAHAF